MNVADFSGKKDDGKKDCTNATPSSPLPQARLGGEGWVRGRRTALRTGSVNANRFPLIPTFSPKASLGEKEFNA